MECLEIIVSLLTMVGGVLIALYIDRTRFPSLEIRAGEEANDDNRYQSSNPRAGGRWKFFRVSVKNKPMPWLLKWLPRQTAENCRAELEFYNENQTKLLFSFNGRWASTPEIPVVPRDSYALKVLYPDPVSIPVSKAEFLDVITKHEHDTEAYGWNNEAYFNNWRTPKYRLTPGSYIIKVVIHTQNGVSFSSEFRLEVGSAIEETNLGEKRAE